MADRFAYYVYYRVRDPDNARDRERAAAFVAELARTAAATGSLRQRREEPGLWMEVFDDIADPGVFEAALAEHAHRWRVEEWLAAGERRHLECFVER